MTPETTAGKALLDDFHEPKGPCYASPACEHGEIIAAIEQEARRTVVAELRAEVDEHIPYDGQDQSDSCWIYCACGWNANDDAKDSWTDHIDAAIARRLGGSE